MRSRIRMEHPGWMDGSATTFVSRSARSGRAVRYALAALLLLGAPGAASQDQPSYTIGVRDVLEISVFNQSDLSGRYTVETDGAFSFPLIGRVTAAGRTVEELEETLRARLLDGYFRNPRITVAVAEYRSRQVFVMGEVRSPGAYPLAADTTLIEILSLAGSLTSQASGIAIVVRAGERPAPFGHEWAPGDNGDGAPSGDNGDGAPSGDNGEGAPPGDSGDGARPGASGETIRVNLRDLEGGDMSLNVALRDGDTVFLPRAEIVYVVGEVRSPGSVPIQEGMTVLQALSLAGGATEFAALNRITILRVVDGEQIEVRVQLDDLVERDDTITVPVKFF